jgi:hypothetical protein
MVEVAGQATGEATMRTALGLAGLFVALLGVSAGDRVALAHDPGRLLRIADRPRSVFEAEAASKSDGKSDVPPAVSPEAQRKRSALQQRLLLQQQDLRQGDVLGNRLQGLRQEQGDTLHDQRHLQREQQYQLDKSIRGLRQP